MIKNMPPNTPNGKGVDSVLCALGMKDSSTLMHSQRVIPLAVALGRRLDLTWEELLTVQVSAALHDIGKIGTPDAILKKPGKLSPDELIGMHQHAVEGARIIVSMFPEGTPIYEAILHHHEHFDGGGYPDGLSGRWIPMASRIISVADSFDALMSHRSYHDGLSIKEALSVIEYESGSKHDPDVVREMLRIHGAEMEAELH